MREDTRAGGGVRGAGVLVRGVRDEPHLAGRAVGHAVAPVSAQVEVGGTGALVAASGGQQAEVAAAAVVDLAGVVGHFERNGVKGRQMDPGYGHCSPSCWPLVG